MDQPALEIASVGDVAGLLTLREQLAAWLALRGIDQWQSPMSRDRLVTWVRDGSVHVVRRDDRIVASVTLLDRDEEFWGPDNDAALYVHLLMVARSHAGHGLGGRVLARAETLARDRGVDRVRLDAAADNSGLQRWYEQRGYRAVGSRAFVHGPNQLVVTLREKLLPPSPAA
jgi:GNAT superfamily N-acetyltransferase